MIQHADRYNNKGEVTINETLFFFLLKENLQ